MTLSQLKEEIFTPRCATSFCHSGSSPASNQSLVADRIAQEIIDVESVSDANFKRIAPGDPDNSYIIKKLRGDDGIVGRQMPDDGTAPLPDEDIAMIITWNRGRCTGQLGEVRR